MLIPYSLFARRRHYDNRRALRIRGGSAVIIFVTRHVPNPMSSWYNGIRCLRLQEQAIIYIFCEAAMKKLFDTIREPVYSAVPKDILHSLLILSAGIALGTIAKALDETASNVLPSFMETLDLRNFFSRMGFWLFSGVCVAIYSRSALRAALNVFVFFAGMVSSYYIYTVCAAGFFPKAYMMIWIRMTILSPLPGAVCWYAKGTHPVSICLSAAITAIMARQAFAFGFWYLDVRYAPELLLWFLMISVLYKTPKQSLTVAAAGAVLFLITSQFNLFWGMV